MYQVKVCFYKIKNNKIISSVFSNDNGMKLETDKQQEALKNPQIFENPAMQS